MATLRVSVVGSKELQRKLERMDPGRNKRIMRNSLLESALLVQRDAAKNQILAGGGGKKGGMTKAHPRYLTSRTGTLRRSIKVDRGPLPFAIEVGTDLVYGALHEFGLGRTERPFMQPALDRVAPKFGEIVVKHWKREARL
jgi:phage gpG-like protein